MKVLNLNDRLTAGKLVVASEKIVAILTELLQDEKIRPAEVAGMLAIQLGKLLKLIGLKRLWPILRKRIQQEVDQIA